MKISRHPKIEIMCIALCDIVDKQAIEASKSSREITQNMIRVKSSNLWAHCIDIKRANDKTGNVYIQFKGANGGAGDIYVYYDVPIVVYRKLIGAPSQGHAFWQYIRGKYTYAKLTGDKKTKMKGGVNSQLSQL